jgi:beta-N-acetylhexosaminidase
VVPRPQDLTLSDTSSHVTPALASAVRRHHPRVDEILMKVNPDESEVRALRNRLASYDLVIVGTINATMYAGQAALVKALWGQGTPMIVVAMRLPYDLSVFPEIPTYACTYSILPPSMNALADALWGLSPFRGKLPVVLPKSLTALAL